MSLTISRLAYMFSLNACELSMLIVNLQMFIAEHHAQIEKSGLLRTIIKLWKVQLTFKDHYKNKLIELMYNKRIKKIWLMSVMKMMLLIRMSSNNYICSHWRLVY